MSIGYLRNRVTVSDLWFWVMVMVTLMVVDGGQGCIICSTLPSGMGARGVTSEHVENMEMMGMMMRTIVDV